MESTTHYTTTVQRERDEQWIHAAHSIMRTWLIEKFQESTKTIATNGL